MMRRNFLCWKMRARGWALALIAVATTGDGSATPNPGASADQIFHGLIGRFQGIDSLRFDVSKKVEILDASGNDTGQSYVETLSYAARGGRYKYTYVSKTAGAGSDDFYTVAFDGTHGYFLDHGNGELVILPSKDRDLYLSNMQGVFEPFAFLLASDNDGTSAGAFKFPTLQDYQSPSIWTTFVKQLASSKTVVHGTEDTICLTLPGGMMPWRSLPTTFTVYLSTKDHDYPIAWEREADNGSFRYTYQVKNLQTVQAAAGGVTLTYPQEATMEKYKGRASIPGIRADIEVKNVAVGDIKDADLTIDPAQAKFITDRTVTPARITSPK